jgi:hypothetical protein
MSASDTSVTVYLLPGMGKKKKSGYILPHLSCPFFRFSFHYIDSDMPIEGKTMPAINAFICSN